MSTYATRMHCMSHVREQKVGGMTVSDVHNRTENGERTAVQTTSAAVGWQPRNPGSKCEYHTIETFACVAELLAFSHVSLQKTRAYSSQIECAWPQLVPCVRYRARRYPKPRPTSLSSVRWRAPRRTRRVLHCMSNSPSENST